MQRKLKIKINFFCLVIFCFSLFFDFYTQLAIYFIVLFFHELMHSFIAKLYGYNLNNMVFMPYGAVLNNNNCNIFAKNEIVIAIIPPILNILFSFLIMGIWWVFPNIYFYTYDLIIANFAIGIFNLLPIFPLDGGRVLFSYLKLHMKKVHTCYVLSIITSIVFSLVFLFLFVATIFNARFNFSYLFISFFLLISCVDFKMSEFYSVGNVQKSFDNFKPILKKELIVPSDYPFIKLLKYLNLEYFFEFIFIDKYGNVVKRLTEVELINLLKSKNN